MASADNTNITPSLAKLKQRNLLVESLSALRSPGKADVVLVAGGVEFYAHKLILEAVSPYFVALLQCQREEHTLSKVVLNEMTPETLEAVLDFIYLGETENVKTQEQVINVFQASRMMQLKDLANYCCSSLLQMLSLDNFLGIWALSRHFETEGMLPEVLKFITQNLSDVLSKNAFLFATAEQVKELLKYAKDRLTSLDKLLLGLFSWVKYDQKVRITFATELLACVEAKSVSSQCLKSLLQDPSNYDIIQVNFQQFERLTFGCSEKTDPKKNDEFFGSNVLSEKSDSVKLELEELNDPSQTKNSQQTKQFCESNNNFAECGGQKIIIFAQQTTADLKNDISNCSGSRKRIVSKIQEFDLSTLSWLPAVTLPDHFQFKVDALCQFKEFLCMVGSEGGEKYVLHDIKKNVAQYVSCANNVFREKAALCYFKECLFLVGGNSKNGTPTAAVHYVPTNRRKHWCATSPLNHCHSGPTVLTSEHYLYVTGRQGSESGKLTVECTAGPQVHPTDNKYCMSWVTIDISHTLIGLQAHLFLSNNKLRCLHLMESELQQMMQKTKWLLQGLPPPEGFSTVKSVLHFAGNKSDILYVSTTEDKFGIPSFTHKLGSNQWVQLPQSMGECEVENYGNILTVNTVGI